MSFRIRGIHDSFLPVNRRAIEQILKITASEIADMTDEALDKIRGLFTCPVINRMRHYFFVAENSHGDILGFAQMSHSLDMNFCFLDLLANNPAKRTGGIGEALYNRAREEAKFLNASGLFLECMSDDPALLSDTSLLKQNRARLKFYERLGARPLLNPAFEKHCHEYYGNPYFLLFDSLGRDGVPAVHDVKKIFTAVVEKKHNKRSGDKSVKKIREAMKDYTIAVRPPKYSRKEPLYKFFNVPEDRKIPVLYNEGHEIHHIKEKGYMETPVRIKSILKKIGKSDIFTMAKTRRYSERHISAVHDRGFINYFKRASASVPPGVSLYPDTFPIRKKAKPPKKLVSRAGYYCIDIYSPVNRNSYLAARSAVNCALTGADLLLEGYNITYALVRPPGHHAERSSFGGFCYFNSAAIAASHLSGYGRVAILDLDYHHGNGQQDIFYGRDDVLTISIHADPDYEYPYFSGFTNERGEGEGTGFNINHPLPEKTDGPLYSRALKKALKEIESFRPEFLIIALGFDTAKGDPSGKWSLLKDDFYSNGKLIGKLKLSTLVVQEGGYDSRVLGINALSFFQGLYSGRYGRQQRQE